MNRPDPSRHLKISLIKSAIRRLACAGYFTYPFLLPIGFLIAGFLGAIEELV